MFNKITLLTSMFLLLFAFGVSAHSHLEDSTPKNGENLTEPLKDITLTFETDIEPASSFTLTNDQGAEIALLPITVSGNQLIGAVENELVNGAYSIHWKIIGEGGHLLEGDIPFTVQLPEASAPAEDTATGETTETAEIEEAGDTVAVMEQEDVETKNAESEGVSLMNYLVPGIIGLIIVVGFGSYWFIFRRKYV